MANYKSRRARRKRRERALPAIIIAAAVLVFGLLIYNAARPRPGMAQPDLGNQHITYPETATYNTSPPTSGPHYTTIAPWGIHAEPIPNELQVHNLEDGGVMVQYNCPDGCPDLVEQLSSVVERYDEMVILAPYPDMDSRIALTAWGRLDTLEEFDKQRIVKFINAYRGIDHHR
jgi:hypothetical protein